VSLDLSQVAELDTSGLQMLLLVQRLAAADGRGFALREPSAAAREVLDLCGLTDLYSSNPKRMS
jgi:anti-anti-sigma regulatory factor